MSEKEEVIEIETVLVVEAVVFEPKFKDNVLTVIPKVDDVFLMEGALKPWYLAVVERLKANVVGLDVTKAKGRKAIRSVAQSGRNNKTMIDDSGKGVKKKYEEKFKNIDPQRREAKQAIDEAIEEILKPVIAEENREANRKKALENAILEIEGWATKEDGGHVLDVADLQKNMDELNETTFEKLVKDFDIKGEELNINCTIAMATKKLQGYIDDRIEYEAGQVRLKAADEKEAVSKKVDAKVLSLRTMAKFKQGLTSKQCKALIYTMGQQPIDKRYGDRMEEAQDVKDLCISKLEKARDAAKVVEAEEVIHVKPKVGSAVTWNDEDKCIDINPEVKPIIQTGIETPEDREINAELLRWSTKVDTFLVEGVTVEALKEVIKVLSGMKVDPEEFGKRLAEANETKEVLVAKLKGRVAYLQTSMEEGPTDEPADEAEEITVQIAVIISEILGCDVSDSLQVVESMVDGKLSDFVTIN